MVGATLSLPKREGGKAVIDYWGAALLFGHRFAGAVRNLGRYAVRVGLVADRRPRGADGGRAGRVRLGREARGRAILPMQLFKIRNFTMSSVLAFMAGFAISAQ
ncbi:hypothetical protein [Kibdelosporangium philippinense]|uniref:hypothetical protein n=1 Tax=Kibdelosporangium philippinense TaxID=211113 RepID=UPI003619DCC1